jgi:predicted KAP-like P-loop ATPase
MSEPRSDDISESGPATTGKDQRLSPDRPLTNPETDRLGYAPFARALATAVAGMPAPDGIVLALYGQWGLGKTTALNFIEHYLEAESQQDQLVLRFNPWLFTGRVDLAVIYLSELQKLFQRRKILTRKARRALSTLSMIVGGAPVPGADIAKGIGEALDPGAPDVRALKNDVASALQDQKKRLVVVIDDIDRLTPSEVRQLFSVIKSVADFPNTVYVLAFDSDVVSKALSEGGVEGRSYIDKIVQVPFELPVPDRSALQGLLMEQLEQIVGQVDTDLLDNEDLGTMLHFALMPVLETPRDVIRLTNSVRVTYAAVRGQVNVVDFLGLEAARIFLPPLYNKVRANPEMFGVARGLVAAARAAQVDDRRQFHAGWVQALPEKHQEAAKELAGWLIPETADVLNGVTRRSRNVIQSRTTRRVTSPEFYPLYFRLTLGDAVIARELVTALIDEASDAEAFVAAILELANEATSSGRTRASVMLDELAAHPQKFDVAAIPGIIRELLSRGDELWLDNDDEPLGVGNDYRIWWLIEALLDRLERDDRQGLLNEAVRASRSVSTPVRVVVALAYAFGVDGGSIRAAQVAEGMEERALVSSAAIAELEDAAAARIAEAAAGSVLFDAPMAPWVIGRWAEWSAEADVRDWFDAARADDAQLGRLLLSFLQKAVMPNGETRHRLNPAWFDRYVDHDSLAADVHRLKKTAIGEVVEAVAQFLSELDALASGRDPDHPLRWET